MIKGNLIVAIGVCGVAFFTAYAFTAEQFASHNTQPVVAAPRPQAHPKDEINLPLTDIRSLSVEQPRRPVDKEVFKSEVSKPTEAAIPAPVDYSVDPYSEESVAAAIAMALPEADSYSNPEQRQQQIAEYREKKFNRYLEQSMTSTIGNVDPLFTTGTSAERNRLQRGMLSDAASAGVGNPSPENYANPYQMLKEAKESVVFSEDDLFYEEQRRSERFASYLLNAELSR